MGSQNEIVKAMRERKKAPNIATLKIEDDLIKAFREMILSDKFTPIKPIDVDLSQNEEILLYAEADDHIGSFGSNIDKIIRYLDTIKNIPNCYIALLGDIMNNANNIGKSSSLENALSPKNEQKVIHKLFNNPRILSKIIASVSGNHESGARSKESGLDSLVTPMGMLGLIEIYNKYMALLNVKIKTELTPNGVAESKILLWHGSGIKGKAGKVLDQLFNLVVSHCQPDLVLIGHTHKSAYAVNDMWEEQLDSNRKLKRSCTVINVAPAEEMSEYAAEAGMAAPNTDRFLIRMRAVRNFDTLDTEGQCKPYKTIFDMISLDRKDLIDFSKQQYSSKTKNRDIYEIASNTNNLVKSVKDYAIKLTGEENGNI